MCCSIAASEDVVTKYKLLKLAPSSVGKNGLLLLSHIFDASLLQRSDILTFLEGTEDLVVAQPAQDIDSYVSNDTVSLIISAYRLTFNLGEKEASGALAITPFLFMSAELLCSATNKTYYVDPQFVVYEMATRGRNPATDLAIIVS